MDKEIRIACQGAAAMEYTDLTPFQGDLKTLHKDDYEKLKGEILKSGFSFAIHFWRNKGKNYIIDGHQRWKTVQNMVEKEGFKCPALPVVPVEAKSFKEARRKVLGGVSQFGKIEGQGLYEFLHEAQIAADDFVSSFKVPELNTPKFVEEFFTDVESDPLDVASVQVEGEDSEEAEGGRVASSHVPMVQLFFNESTHAKFLLAIDRLKKIYGIDNVTDAVMQAVMNEDENHSA